MPDPEATNGVRVLVVDDDATIRDVLADVIAQEGYTALTAASGRDALTLIALSPPDMILLDMQMPGLNGRDVVQQLRTRKSQIPIVIMTASPHSQIWAEEFNVTHFLAKPFDLDDMVATLDRVLSTLP